MKCGNIFSYHSSGGGMLLVCDGVDDKYPEMHRQPHPSTKKNHLALKVNPAAAEKPCVCENLRKTDSHRDSSLDFNHLTSWTLHQESELLLREMQYSLQEKTLPLYDCVAISFHNNVCL